MTFLALLLVLFTFNPLVPFIVGIIAVLWISYLTRNWTVEVEEDN